MESSRVNVFHKYNSQMQLCSITVYKILYTVIKNPINAHHTSKG